MHKIYYLILLTGKEITGQRIYRILMAALLIMPWLLLIPASLFMLELGKVFMDLLFAMQHAWMLVVLFFLAAPLIARDIEQGNCHLFLTLPMPRSHYLWARYGGVLVACIPLLAAYLISAYLAFIFAEHQWTGYFSPGSANNFCAGAGLIALPYIALAAALFLIASLATGLPEITVFLFSIWLLCWSLPPVLGALNRPEVVENTPIWIITLLHTVNQLLPDLSSSQISLYMAHGIAIHTTQVAAYCVEHISYALLVMIIASVSFNRRDLV